MTPLAHPGVVAFDVAMLIVITVGLYRLLKWEDNNFPPE